MKNINQILAEEFQRPQIHIDNVISLIDEGNTIPFIARYRKEMHGAMDDTMLRDLFERLNYLRSLEERRNVIKNSIEEQGKLTEELSAALDEAVTLSVLEDLYRPYKPKRRTRATVAKEKGLEPLADEIFVQDRNISAPEALAEAYVNEDKGVASIEEALAGASDIIAERISDDAEVRKILKELFRKNGFIESSNASDEDSVYSMYYDFRQPAFKMQGHQTLAVNRGETEGFLKVSLVLDRELALQNLRRYIIMPGTAVMEFMKTVIADAYDRLLYPSVEREIRNELTDTACDGAIRNFALNLKPLLMQPPVKGNVTMGLDPGYRNGCKVAVVDGTGKVLDTAVVYPTFSDTRRREAIRTLSALIKKHDVKHIAIGNGTASRETEQMTAEMLHELNGGQSYAIVNEAGASVYSASKLAAEEFPDYDVNLRSAVSIARRLQDPLAELVKIEPMSIGVGQYQHDMPQAKLKETLYGVVEDCVNSVGVDLNTASSSLLERVSGLTKTTAKNIVAYREENGAFKSRSQLLKVPKLGPKAYQQCAGFLRVPESSQMLDNTAVHPESYEAAGKLLSFCAYSEQELKSRAMGDIRKRIEMIGADRLSEKCGVGVPTLLDIADELAKPGRDPRDDLPPVVLRQDVLDMDDLQPGMILQGTVRNVIDFGAFVDIGVHQDGLVHISRICDKFIRHPGEVLSVGDIVKVKVLEVDKKKKRIALTMKNI